MFIEPGEVCNPDGGAPSRPAAGQSGGAVLCLADWQKDRILDHISRHIDRTIPIDDLVALTRLSGSYFFRAFKASFGTTPHAFVLGVRIRHAQFMLSTTREPISQIAVACGLNDQAHMSKLFRRQTGTAPAAWRRHMTANTRSQIMNS